MTSDNHKLNLLIGFHSHIPIDTNQNNIKIEKIKNTLELIELVNNFQNIKVTFHFSGNLINYLDKNYTDFSPKIRNLLERNQLELFSGGRYEPIFPSIPKEDRELQLSLMNRLLNHTYGYTPNGAWITESAWEPSLALDLAKSRINYICLPKEYFKGAGIEENKITGYFLTEEEGRKVAVFPIKFQLNTLIKDSSPEDTINNLLQSKNNLPPEDSSIVTFYEGLIDNTNELKWLNDFFQLLNNNTENIDTKLFNDYFTNTKSKGRIYLPSLQKTKSQNTSQFWKQLLINYHEANLLHKKMLRVSKKINSAKEGKSRFKVIREMISKAQDLLLKGQACYTYNNNDASSIHFPEERYNTYSNLIKAENLIDAASRQNSKWIQVSEIDYDCDGNDEIIIETETQNIYISPGLGGSVLEHDYRPKNINLTNTVTFDSCLKLSIIDHFLHSDLSLEKCRNNNLPYLTKEMISPYTVHKIKAKEETCKITLNLKTNLIKLQHFPEIELQKQISTKSSDSSLTVDYILINKSLQIVSFIFAIEFNLNPISVYDKSSYFYLDGNPQNKSSKPDLKAEEEIKAISQISFHNHIQKLNLTMSWSKPCDLFRYPIFTTYNNNGNTENVYQGFTFLPNWNLTLEPNAPFELSIKQDITTVVEEI